jgi:prophage regulatory protein
VRLILKKIETMNPTKQSPTTSTRQLRILRLPEVKAKTGFARSTIYALMASGEFPSSIRIGARAVGWLESDIDQWIETCRIGTAYDRG